MGLGTPPPDEDFPIGFILHACFSIALEDQAMGDVNGWIVVITRSTRCNQRTLSRDSFGLDEQLTEGRVLAVGSVRSHGEFDIACDLDLVRAGGAVDKRNTADLNIVFRRDHDLRLGLDPIIRTAEYRPIYRETHLIRFGFFIHRMIGVGPNFVAIQVFKVAIGTPRIARRIRPPSRQVRSAPSAVPTASIRHHQ